MTDKGLTAQLIEQASTKALGWVLEQYCELSWDEEDSHLIIFFNGNHQMAHELLCEEDTLKTIESIVYKLTNQSYAIYVVTEGEHPIALSKQNHDPIDINETVEGGEARQPFSVGDKRFWITRGREESAEETPLPTYIERLEAQLQEKDRLLQAHVNATGVRQEDTEGISNQGQVIDPSAALVTWKDLKFRSQSEVRIAEALDKHGVLFLPN